jgi:toxin-antitoxin system PIN domain toxin
VIIVDLNLLVYVVNRSALQHVKARKWWESCLSQGTSVGLAWTVMLGFVRLTTSPRLMRLPLSPAQAMALLDEWLAHPAVDIVEPGSGHWEIVKELITDLGAAGNLTSDAHLAALAIERGARLCSADNDFSRFSRLRWSNPLD